MKTFRTLFVLLPVLFTCILSDSYAQYALWVSNSSDCSIQYEVYCQNSSCDEDLSQYSGTIPGPYGPDELVPIPCDQLAYPYFAYLWFNFPDGDNTWRSISFHPDLNNACATLECTQGPFEYLPGTIEEECLGSKGGVRANRTQGNCTIFFHYDD